MTPLLRVALAALRSGSPRLLAIAAVTLTLQASCARSVSSEPPPDAPILTPGAKELDPLTVCVATECPLPWATCPGGGLCTTNTSRDIEHCGSCGVACPQPPHTFHATSVCSNSKCSFACDELSADCNHKDSDGCEVFTGDDPKNCGGCGNVCKTGDICWKGACGCPTGFTQCGDECKNLQSDDLNCGTCGTLCVAPKAEDPKWKCGPEVQPANTTWGCANGGCDLTCMPSFGDCDDNMCSNGCETDERSDPKNCGACGHACAANQDCVDGTCICPPGTVRCDNRCVDVNVDPDNCGACGKSCPGADDNGAPTCSKGRCDFVCYPGFANCDGKLGNGCEVNIGNDPLHCGGCNTKCDAGRGQPCVSGQCLTKPCEPGRGVF